MQRIFFGLVLAGGLVGPAVAGDFDNLVAKSGNWHLFQAKDAMTDRLSCTGLHKGNVAVQLSTDTLFIRIPGGVESLQLRFDDEGPSGVRLATAIEKRMGTADIGGADFGRVMNASRLRYVATTMVRGLASGDLDLEGIGQALTAIRGSCTPEALTVAGLARDRKTSAATAITTSAASASTSELEGACSPAILARMKAQRLTTAQIAAICN